MDDEAERARQQTHNDLETIFDRSLRTVEETTGDTGTACIMAAHQMTAAGRFMVARVGYAETERLMLAMLTDFRSVKEPVN